MVISIWLPWDTYDYTIVVNGLSFARMARGKTVYSQSPILIILFILSKTTFFYIILYLHLFILYLYYILLLLL